jgi:putative flippase GtrA
MQRSLKPRQQIVRYMLVGGFNTVFGYGLFALLNWSLRPVGHYSYLLASLLSNIIAISVAFLGYKWIVFRSRGSYIAEWLRCMGVYGSSMLITLAGLAILVPLLERCLHRPGQAAYLGAAIMAVVTVILSFLGHKHYSFRPRQSASNLTGIE